MCICLFAIDEELQTRAIEFLRAAFAAFPEKNHLLLTVPHLAQELPLLESFTRAPFKPRNTLPHELYLVHRFGLISFAFLKN